VKELSINKVKTEEAYEIIVRGEVIWQKFKENDIDIHQ